MSETFKPGQTVWHRSTREMFDIIAVNRPNCWCWSVSRCHYETISDDMLTATDSNAEPLPQKCPHCGNLQIEMFEDVFYAECTYCKMSGPVKPSRLAAINAWNSIRIAKE